MNRLVKLFSLSTLAGLGMAGWYGYKHRDNQTAVLNMLTPKSTFGVKKNISYGALARQMLDIYRPKNTQAPAPVILFVHGGSWQNGSKDDYVFLGESLAREGLMTVVINYRLAPGHTYPDFVDDTALAIKWTINNIANHGGDATKLFVMGHSAGAFNAVASVDDPRFFDKYDIPTDAVKAVVGVAGPYSYDFRKDSSRVAFPAEGDPDDIMPNRHVRKNPVPHLLLLAEKDNMVRDYNTFDLAKALKEQGGKAQIARINNINHITIMAAFATRLRWMADTKAVVLEFLKQFL